MSRREDRNDFLRAGDRFRVEYGDGPGHVVVLDATSVLGGQIVRHADGVHVAEIGHLARAVMVDRPEMMIAELTPVVILPSRVENPSVRQNSGRVFRHGVAADRADVAAFRVALVEDRDGDFPAHDPTIASRGAEDDFAVRHVRRLDVVERSVGELREARPVDVDFVEVIIFLAARSVGKDRFASVVMDLRIAHAALGIVQQRRDDAGCRIEPFEFPPDRVGLLLGIRAVVSKIGVIVPVDAIGSNSEEDGIAKSSVFLGDALLDTAVERQEESSRE